MADFQLFDYQREVVARALQGENTIVWLPTGAGKTRAAVYVAKKHLETTPKAKVVVIVNKVHLVDQHYSKEFRPHLGNDYKLEPVSGESNKKDFFGKVVQTSDVVICTAQILYNALINTEETRHVELSDITLLIIDECHHTHKESAYNKIMGCYVEKKVNGEKPLPQILGLTASPGTGGAKTKEKAVEHVLQICANLDSAIVSTELYTPELEKKVAQPIKSYDIVEKRLKDPFEDHLKFMMQQIHEYMTLPPDFTLRELGTQEYESDVVMLEKRGVKDSNRLLAQCALHLREYNDALLINDTLRMMDAYRSLEEFYSTKPLSIIDGTDEFLLALFQANQVELRTLAGDSRNENPKMFKLESVLLRQFGPNVESKGIIFTKTRKSTRCLHEWIHTNKDLQNAGIKAAILTGAGNGITHMTLNDQAETIGSFRKGTVNLLIATSVAEEGLDIPECNLVVRYGLLTNEIAQQQTRGRARAQDSNYSVIAQRGGREERRERTNEYLEELTGIAIAQVQKMSPQVFRTKIRELQKYAVLCTEHAKRSKMEKQSENTAASVQLLCRNCQATVASASDLKVVESMHYVNVNPDFKKHYKSGGIVRIDRTFEDWTPGCKIYCNNGKCNMEWGFEIRYKKYAMLPNLAIKNFALKTVRGIQTAKKWKDVTFTVEPFNFEKYCEDHFPDILD
ncbi:uncharacterized protein V6R79_016027 [Siganus canaliculatus]